MTHNSLPQWTLDMAPCLSTGPYQEEAQQLIKEALNVKDDAYGAFLKVSVSVNLSSVFYDKIEFSKEDPLIIFKKALIANRKLLSTYKSARPIVSYAVSSKKNEKTIENVTAEHYGSLFPEFSLFHYYEEPTMLLKDRLERNDFPMDKLKGKRGLDAGCGNGRYTVALRNLGMSKVVGIDLSEDNINDASSRVKEENIRGVSFKVGNVLDIPEESDSFDFVFSNGVLHHTTDCQKGVHELLRVLKPGGIGFFRVIADPGGIEWDFIELCRIILKEIPHEYLRDIYTLLGIPANKRYLYLDHMLVPINIRYTPDECVKMLENAGAENIRRLERGSDTDGDERVLQGKVTNGEDKYGIYINRYYFEKPENLNKKR